MKILEQKTIYRNVDFSDWRTKKIEIGCEGKPVCKFCSYSTCEISWRMQEWLEQRK